MRKIRLGVFAPKQHEEGLIATGAAIALGVGAAASAGGTIAGAVIGANAMDSAADKQAYVAQQQLQASKEEIAAQRAERAEAVRVAGQLSQKSYGEAASIERMLRTKEQGLSTSLANLNKEMELLAQTDPVIKEAGSQLVKLMQGEQSKMLEPVRAEQEKQRKDLEGRLSAAMGPGWRTSSAGIEAMSKFNSASTSALVDAQFKAVNQAAAVFTNAATVRPKNLGLQTSEIFKGAAAIDSAVGGMEQNIQNRITSSYLAAQTGNPVNFGSTTGAFGQQLQVAGQSDIAKGKLQGDLFGDLGSGIGKIGGYIAGKTFGETQSAPTVGAGSGLDLNEANFR